MGPLPKDETHPEDVTGPLGMPPDGTSAMFSPALEQLMGDEGLCFCCMSFLMPPTANGMVRDVPD
jgi:hypothetical protein